MKNYFLELFSQNTFEKLRRIKELLGVFGPKLLGAP